MKKVRLYLKDIIEDPIVSYPAWYMLTPYLAKNENLKESLRAIHSMAFESYHYPNSPEEIFTVFSSGYFPIYKERYVVGYFGAKMMYLESSGWRQMALTKDSFDMQNWLL